MGNPDQGGLNRVMSGLVIIMVMVFSGADSLTGPV
jgi:hypothetical protein